MSSWPLIGRTAELRAIEEILAAPGNAGVVLAGGAGVGKTRLADEVMTRARAEGSEVVRVRGSRAASPLPLGALAALLPATTAARSPSDLLRWACEQVIARAEGRPVALMVDDAHLLDDTSAALVFQLAVAGDAFVVVTVRSEEPAPDPVVALWKDEVTTRLDLEPLDAASLEALLTAVLGGAVDRATVKRLVDTSEGNVLYLRELVSAARDRGVLRAEGGVWRMAGSFVVSPRLAELLTDRISDLTPAERDVVELIAFADVIGSALLEREHGRPTLERLEERGIIVVDRDQRRLHARLSHPLYGDVVRARVPTLRARRLNGRLAALLENAGGRRREDDLRIASALLEAGDVSRPAVLFSAAQTARRRWDVGLAHRLATAAVDGGAGFDARLLLAQLSFLRGRPAEAEAEFARLTVEATDDEQTAAVAHGRIDNLMIGLGRGDDALAVATEARTALRSPRHQEQMSARMAAALFVLGRTGDAIAQLQPLLAGAQGQTLVDLAVIGSLALSQAGQATAAIELGRRGREAHLALGGPPSTFGTHVGLLGPMQALINSGWFDEAETLVLSEYEQAVAAGSGEAHASFAQMACLLFLRRGRVATALRYGAEAIALFEQFNWAPHLWQMRVQLVHANALAGRVEEAAAQLSALDTLPAAGVGKPLDLEARAWLDVAAGDQRAGTRRLWEAAAWASERGDHAHEAFAVHGLIRLAADVVAAAARLRQLAELVEGPLSAARCVHADALQRRDAAALDQAASGFETIGAWLYAAEAAAQAAVAHRQAGDRRRSVGAERRAAQLARRCEGATTPALRGVESQVLLTARELEVAGLAAAGLANRAIAERLSVSVRTVETQLQRAYEKLGVRTRSDLRGALDLDGTPHT